MTPPDLEIDPDAVRWSASEADREGRPLLVLMHGYGSNEDDLFALAPYLPLAPVIASLRAPIAEAGGYAWFSHHETGTGVPTLHGADTAASAVIAWLDALAVRPSGIGLLGFSQGGAMVLQLLRRAPGRFDYGVQLSGFVVPGEDPGDAALATLRPAVFAGRGTADSVIPAELVAYTGGWMSAHARPDARIYEGAAHEVTPAELADVSAFIAAHARGGA